VSQVSIFWDPTSLTVDSLGKKKLIKISDGDTASISVSIRMLSIDTPELHYPNNKKTLNARCEPRTIDDLDTSRKSANTK